jgi:C-terminal processing protease CtpA/Prc
LGDKLVLQGCGSSADWPGLLNRLRDGHSISLVRQNDPYLPTDSTAFYLQGVPALNFFTGATDAYHSPKDLASTLNYQGIKQIDDLLVALILELEAKPDMISYQSVPKPGDRSQHSLRIYLGTIPDYTSGVKMGVKLAGVAQNSPAQQAGLQHDDVITELDGNRIHDIYDYTYALNALHAGEPAKMKVRRGQTNIDLTVVARYRD